MKNTLIITVLLIMQFAFAETLIEFRMPGGSIGAKRME
jgi:uncharacterized paraquat-inducible protein A